MCIPPLYIIIEMYMLHGPCSSGWLTGKMKRGTSAAPSDSRIAWATDNTLGYKITSPHWKVFGDNPLYWSLMDTMETVATECSKCRL